MRRGRRAPKPATAEAAPAQPAPQAQPAPELRRGALGVVADARYAQKRYADAEAAYLQLVRLPAASERAAVQGSVVDPTCCRSTSSLTLR